MMTGSVAWSEIDAIACAIVSSAMEAAVTTGTPTLTEGVFVETVPQASIFAMTVSASFFAI